MRILVVGHGLIGRQRAAAAHELASVAATVDPVERDASLYGGAPHFASLADVDLASFDAAVVALPHDLAVPTTFELLQAGKPVLVEKPLGLTAADAKMLDDAASDLPCFVGYNYRFLPHVVDVFGALDQIGKLRSVDMLIGHGGHPGSAEGWKLRPERAGGGVLLDPGVHLLDLLLLLAPSLELALAAGTRGFWKTGIEEDLLLAFRSDEVLASVRVSHIRWVNDLRIEIVGEDGYALIEGRGGNYGPMRSRIGRRWAWSDDPEGRAQRETEVCADHGSANASLDVELASVIAAWRGDQLPPGPAPATFAEGRRVTELVEALYAQLLG